MTYSTETENCLLRLREWFLQHPGRDYCPDGEVETTTEAFSAGLLAYHHGVRFTEEGFRALEHLLRVRWMR